MKKILMICFMLVITFVLVGCNNESKKENTKNIEILESNYRMSTLIEEQKKLVSELEEKSNESHNLIKKDEEETICNNDSEVENNDKAKVTLNMETEKYIKQCVINYNKSKIPTYSKTIDDIIIKHYYGDFNGIQIAVIEGDTISKLAVTSKPFYGCIVGSELYWIKCLPEIISVYYENNYYTLQEACIKGLITREILDQLDCYYGMVK